MTNIMFTNILRNTIAFIGAFALVPALPSQALSQVNRFDQHDPKDMIYQIYGCSQSQCGRKGSSYFDEAFKKILSSDTRKDEQKASTKSEKNGQQCWDASPTQFNDAAVSRIDITDIGKSSNYEVLRVKLTETSDTPNLHEYVTYVFARENGVWFIDDILNITGGVDHFPTSLKYILKICQ
jgi:hypothetical protein